MELFQMDGPVEAGAAQVFEERLKLSTLFALTVMPPTKAMTRTLVEL
jgi:hypothetical protein